MSDEIKKTMNPAQREARKAFREVEAKKAMTDHERDQAAFSANRERLKAERLTREAAAPVTAAADKKSTSAKGKIK